MYTVKPIGIAHTPFQQKFAIPRQAGLVEYPSTIELLAPYNQAEAIEGLEQVSHIWVHFIFHQHVDKKPQLQVRPPRLGGNKKLGVFATRSSFRPNALGQSLVKLEKIELGSDGVILHVLGLDVLDNTPIIDIKPYIPYSDYAENAKNLIADSAPEFSLQVSINGGAKKYLDRYFAIKSNNYINYIKQIISLDPRPAYKKGQASGEYAMQLFGLDIHWRMIAADTAEITHCMELNDK